jgi:hypothetical protein
MYVITFRNERAHSLRLCCVVLCCVRLLSKRTYKAILLPVVLYECETWSPTLSGDHRLRVLENRVLREIFWAEEGWSDGRVEKTA